MQGRSCSLRQWKFKKKTNIDLGGCKVKNIKLYLCLVNMRAGLFTIKRSQNCRNSQILQELTNILIQLHSDLRASWICSSRGRYKWFIQMFTSPGEGLHLLLYQGYLFVICYSTDVPTYTEFKHLVCETMQTTNHNQESFSHLEITQDSLCRLH